MRIIGYSFNNMLEPYFHYQPRRQKIPKSYDRSYKRICFIHITFHIELSRLETPATLYRRDDTLAIAKKIMRTNFLSDNKIDIVLDNIDNELVHISPDKCDYAVDYFTNLCSCGVSHD
jgi:hypothetical protein